MICFDLRAAEVKRGFRSRHVGHDGGCSVDEHVEEPVLHHLRRIAEDGEHAERDRRLERLLEGLHAPMHFEQPL